MNQPYDEADCRRKHVDRKRREVVEIAIDEHGLKRRVCEFDSIDLPRPNCVEIGVGA
jgi:hypothetical protein